MLGRVAETRTRIVLAEPPRHGTIFARVAAAGHSLPHHTGGQDARHRRRLPPRPALVLCLARRAPRLRRRLRPEQFTRTAVETYLTHLERAGRSISDRTRVRAVLSSFARFLIEDQGVLRRNPTRQVVVPPKTVLAPRELTEHQRYVIESLVERDDTLRGAAIFALGYWAGCRVSDIAWLRYNHTHITARQGSILVGHKGGKQREIDLHGKVVAMLHAYLQQGGRKRESPYVFTSQRAERLTEAGIHHWFRLLKAQATRIEWEPIHDLLAAFPEARVAVTLFGLLLGMTALRCTLVLKTLADEQLPSPLQHWWALLVQSYPRGSGYSSPWRYCSLT